MKLWNLNKNSAVSNATVKQKASVAAVVRDRNWVMREYIGPFRNGEG
jgi:hypothetical protein